MTDHAPTAREAAASALDLARLLAQAEDVEWKPSPRPRLWESDPVSGGGDGRPSNPTQEIAFDARRLAVRAAVIAAHRQTEEAKAGIQRALSVWNGETRLDDGSA